MANSAIAEMMAKDIVNRQEKEELYHAFSEYSTFLTDEQKGICDKYFGLNYIRSVEEMKLILK
jgi:hypothetical protein